MTISELKNGLFQQATPESVGLSSASVLGFLNELEEHSIRLHSLHIMRYGKVIASGISKPFSDDTLRRIYSAGKILPALAVFLAIDDGKVSLEDKVVSFFPPEQLPEDMDEKYKDMTVYNLLTMNAGQAVDSYTAMRDTENFVKAFFSIPLEYAPGTYWLYNNGIPHILGCIAQKTTENDIPAMLKRRIFDPIGAKVVCKYLDNGEYEPRLNCTTPDAVFRLAVLFLQEGNWNGRQLISSELMRLAGAFHCPTDFFRGVDPDHIHFHAGYGFQLWRNAFGGFRMAGGGGQFGIVIPDEDMAIGLTANTNNEEQLLTSVWQWLFKPLYKHAVAENGDAYAKLQRKLASMTLAPVNTSDSSSMGDALKGKVFRMAPNRLGIETLGFDFGKAAAVVHAKTAAGDVDVSIAYNGNWEENDDYLFGLPLAATIDEMVGVDTDKCLLSGGWSDTETFSFIVRGTTHMLQLLGSFDFSGEKLVVSIAKDECEPIRGSEHIPDPSCTLTEA